MKADVYAMLDQTLPVLFLLDHMVIQAYTPQVDFKNPQNRINAVLLLG
ncbi:MAG: hypothetical protein COB08_019220 [Rhodobacteraceae bacterium]|nr:hypothetical protein [Paracoccaceae bacterium]